MMLVLLVIALGLATIEIVVLRYRRTRELEKGRLEERVYWGNKVIALQCRWGAIAQRKFEDARQESDDQVTRRDALTHGAICYSNCAQELADLICGEQTAADRLPGWVTFYDPPVGNNVTKH